MQPPSSSSPAMFSLRSLARRLDVDTGRLVRLLEQSPIPGATGNGGVAKIPEPSLDAFFQAFAKSEGLSTRAYVLPPEWNTPPTRWESELAVMYRQSCAYPACLSPSQGRQLRNLVLERHPRTVLEIGCFTGVSSIWIASALEELGGEGRLHSIDLFDPIWPWPPYRFGYAGDPQSMAQASAKAAGLEHRITFHKMHSFDLATRYDKVVRTPIDFAFIDGDHSMAGCKHDLVTLFPHVSMGGTIVLHDIHPEYCGWEGPRRVLDQLVLPSPHCRVTELQTEPRNYGIAVIEKRGDDPRLRPESNPDLAAIRFRARLARSSAWRKLRETMPGRLIRRIARR